MFARSLALRARQMLVRLWQSPAFFVTEAAAAVAMLAIETTRAGWAPWMQHALGLTNVVVLAAFGLRVLAASLAARKLPREPGTLAAIAAVLVFLFVSVRVAAAVALLHDVVKLLRWIFGERPGERLLVDIGSRPAGSLVLSFAGLIAVGTFMLFLPAASAGEPVRLIDSFFTAVSATCVTGLITVDTATAWSPFGKLVILVLIQLGGLGIMALSAFMALAFGRALGAKRHRLLHGALDEPDAEELRALVKGVVLWTLSIEGVGAAVLFARFWASMPAGKALQYAVFHAVSAFCNAGFSLFSDSLMGYATDPWVCGTVAGLVVLGGLGFGVLVGLGRLVRAPKTARLTMHTKLVLLTTLILLWSGALLYFFFEYTRSLANLSLGDKVLAAIFQSAMARTAGFNSVPFDIHLIHPVTILVLIVLMFIGAAPGSTGGGIKVTTFAVIMLAARSLVAEREDVEVFGRRLPRQLILRALALTGGAVVGLLLGFGALLVTEQASFPALAFEAASALGTVGLSLGVTPTLSVWGRLIIAALMFAGRVGPLTALSAATRRSQQARITLPEGRVLVG